jgi:uncharacterized protein YhaN
VNILSIHLSPYGPFADSFIDFEEGKGLFHIVYGPNESGKTATLRALRALFFGIPERTLDSFRYEGNKLRIGAALKHSDGSILSFKRRKGRSKTLLTEDEREMDDIQLKKFLAGVDEISFNLMFGFGHEDLVVGGKEIASGGGDIGQSLFSTGSGIIGLQEILKGFDNEAEGLFKTRATSSVINKLVGEYKQDKKEIDENSLKSKEWKEHEELLNNAENRKKIVKERLDSFRVELNRLQRIKGALPIIAEIEEIDSKKEHLGDVLVLRETFKEERIETQKDLAAAEQNKERIEKHIKAIEEEIAKISINEELITQKEVIENTFKRLGSYQKEINDIPALKERYLIVNTEAKNILNEIRPGIPMDEASKIIIGTLKRNHVLSLVDSYGRFEENIKNLTGQIDSIESKKNSAQRSLKEIGEFQDTEKLKKLVADIQKKGDMEKAAAKAANDLKKAEKSFKTGIAKLPLWEGTLEDMEILPVPFSETIDRYEKSFDQINKGIEQIETKIKDKKEELEKINKEVETLEILGGIVPTESDLSELRLKRDEGWRLVRSIYIEKKGSFDDAARIYEPGLPITEAYEKNVVKADEVADRLRRESDKVSKKHIFISKISQLKEDISSLEAQRKENTNKKEELLREWNDIWKPAKINPLTPREMRSWAYDQNDLAKDAKNLRILKEEVETIAKNIDSYRFSLMECLKTFGCKMNEKQSLSEIMEEGRTLIDKNERIRNKRDELLHLIKEYEEQMSVAIKNKKKIDLEINKWNAEWQKDMLDLSLSRDMRPSEVSFFITRNQDFAAKIDEAQGLSNRITAIESNMRKFESDVKKLAEHVSPGLSGNKSVDAAIAVSEMYSMLGSAIKDNTRKNSLNSQFSGYMREINDIKIVIEEKKKNLEMLFEEANSKNVEQVQEAEKKSELALSLNGQLEQLKKGLRAYTAGMKIEEFMAEAKKEDADAILNNINKIQNETEGLSAELSKLEQSIGVETSFLKQADGKSKAAEFAEKKQEVVARLEDSVDRYIKLILASAILRNEIERYRTINQDPILRRASQIFSALTLGSFSGLKTSFDEKDAKILTGIRNKPEEEVRVDGMSEGTCDQLYLSLRIASLERYLELNEPLPLIIDDILINFDDERTAACLKVFSEISKKTQIIYFTHHKRIVDLASESLPSDIFKVHML